MKSKAHLALEWPTTLPEAHARPGRGRVRLSASAKIVLRMARVGVWMVALVSIFGGAITLSASHATVQDNPRAAPSDEEYEIYSSVVKQMYVKPDTGLLVIEDRTFRYDPNLNLETYPWEEKHKGITIDQSTIDDYTSINKKPSNVVGKLFKLPVKTAIVTSDDLRVIFFAGWGQVPWLEFYNRFPNSNGFIMLSRVGFSADHKQALLYTGSRCGPGCWDLHILLLAHGNSGWTVAKEIKKINAT
jgi:hypothetical protein